MNTTPIRVLGAPGKPGALTPVSLSRLARGGGLRAALPVTSNRTYIRAWAIRRAKAAAAAKAKLAAK